MLTSSSKPVGVTATRIAGAAGSPLHLNLHSDSNTEVYIGGSDVTVTSGYHLRKEDTLQVDLYPGEVLYAVSSAPTTLIVMEQQL